MTAAPRPAPRRIPAARNRRRRPAWRPEAMEALEGRALLSLSPVAPSFNGGVAVVSPASPDYMNFGSAQAVAVDSAGRIVVSAMTTLDATSTANVTALTVARYNADGSVDATFGTGGRAVIALPSATLSAGSASEQILIQPEDDKIILAETAYTPGAAPTAVGTAVIRLNADGTPDSTFGAGGQVLITAGAALFQDLALQTNGRIVLGGVSTPAGASAPQVAVTRLNTDGTVDASFNGGAILNFDPATFGTANHLGAVLARPTGQVDVAWSYSAPAGTAGNFANQVVQLKSDGTIDTGFGANGIGRSTARFAETIQAAALQPDGKIVLLNTGLSRINADGTVDATFAVSNVSDGDKILLQPDGKIVVGGSAGATLTGTFNLGDSAFSVGRYTATGLPDRTFGVSGFVRFGAPNAPSNFGGQRKSDDIDGLALTPDGHVVAVGTAEFYFPPVGVHGTYSVSSSQVLVARLKDVNLVSGNNGDYDGDNISDVAAYLAGSGALAYKPSGGGPDQIIPFGSAGVGASIPVSGDFDGDGKADVAIYLPAAGAFAIKPSGGGPAYLVPFGSIGAGASIPVSGDFDGDGKADVAIYLPAAGAFAIKPSGGDPAYLVPFGSIGAGASIPAPGDYDGDGKADVAIYLPAAGAFAIKPSGGGPAYLAPFGPAGVPAIPVPGDYDGNGRTDLALYLPATGQFSIEPFQGASYSNFFAFGSAGVGASIPAPGDYDGDTRTDLAVYLPAFGSLAHISSRTGVGTIQQFGVNGDRQTVPASSIPAAQPPAVAAAGFRSADASAGVLIALTDDLLPPGARKKR